MKRHLILAVLALVLTGCVHTMQTSPQEVFSIPGNVSCVASSASCRIVLVEGGLDPIHHLAYLQWLHEPRTAEDKTTIVSTVEVKEFNGGFWRLYDPEFKTPNSCTLLACYRFSNRAHKITVYFSAAGTYTLKGDLTVRDDEL